MILYVDTSILVKKYIREEYTDEFLETLKDAEAAAVSDVGYAETLAAFARKNREKTITKRMLNSLVRTFKEDWDGLLHILLTEEVNIQAEKLILKHGLRGFDGIHLGSAVELKKRLNENIVFCCADKKLTEAARKEKLKVFPEVG